MVLTRYHVTVLLSCEWLVQQRAMTDHQQLKALIKSSKGPEEKEKMGPVSTKQHRVFQNFPFSGSFIVSFSTMDIAFFFHFGSCCIFIFNNIYFCSTRYIYIHHFIFVFNNAHFLSTSTESAFIHQKYSFNFNQK